MAWRRLGRGQRGPNSGRGGHREGAGVQRGPDDGRSGANVDPTAVEAWRRSRSGCMGDDKMIPPGLGFKG
jgi:hypothetical protein